MKQTPGHPRHLAAFEPLRCFERALCGNVRGGAAGGTRPGLTGAHAGAVSASLRLHSAARLGVAPRTRCAHFVRYAQTGAASQMWMRAARADSKSALLVAPEIAPVRPGRAPPAALQPSVFSSRASTGRQQRRVRAGRGAPLERREAQGSWPRAQRELSTDSSQLFERSERSERSEFCDGATRPSIAGESERSADRSSEAPRPARTRLCRPDHGAQSKRSDSNGTKATRQPRVSRVTRNAAEPLT
jgi:hypothetical protein